MKVILLLLFFAVTVHAQTAVFNPVCCGNGFCAAPDETQANCPADCGSPPPPPPPVCNNNGVCDPGENTSNCPADCPAPPPPPPPGMTLQDVMEDIDAALLSCKAQTGIYKYRCLRDAAQVISDEIEAELE